MRVAVTGAGGRLGGALAAALAAEARVEEVVALDLRPPAPVPRIRPLRLDVRAPDLARHLDGVDAVAHFAFVVLGRGDDAWSVNVDGSRNVFAAAAAAGVPVLVHASSAAAYGCAPDNPVPLTEDRPLRAEPAFYYTRTKVEVERILDDHERRHPEMRVVRLRPVSVLGPGTPVLFGGRAFVTPSDHDPLMQFLWIDDFLELALRTLLEAVDGAFNAGAPDPVPSSAVPALIGARGVRAPAWALRAAARAGGALHLPGGLHPAWVDMARHPIVVDTSRAERELGWRAGEDCAGALRRFGAMKRPGGAGPFTRGRRPRVGISTRGWMPRGGDPS